MTTWETLTMSRKEVPRAGLLKAALAGKISNAQGALAMHLSVRQFQRCQAGFTVAMVEQKASRALQISDVGYVLNMGRVAFVDTAAALLADERVKRLYLGEGGEEPGADAPGG